ALTWTISPLWWRDPRLRGSIYHEGVIFHVPGRPLARRAHGNRRGNGNGNGRGRGRGIGLQLLQRGVGEHQVLDPVAVAEVDLGLRVGAEAVGGHHRAQPVLVVVDQVSWAQRRNGPVPRRADARPLR